VSETPGDEDVRYGRALESEAYLAPESRPRAAEPVPVTVSGARVLRISPDAITVEFEVPFDRFVMPEAEVNVWLDGTTWRVASVVADESSEPGPHSAGFPVRLTLSLVGQAEWRDARSLDLRWLSIPKGGRPPQQIIMNVTVPREGMGPR
jgi:hypothetical protein